MKKLYQKSALAFAIVQIVAYCLLQSLANPLNEKLGIAYSASALLCLAQAAALALFIARSGLAKHLGLCLSPVPTSRFLYYIPLFVLASHNLWNGVAAPLPVPDTVCYLLCMLCVGFVEEIIFRGLLFRAMANNNINTAIIVSSLTFGLGHLLNLVNGSGAALLETLFQVTGAIAVGFLFVILFYRGGSLWPCILTHSAINMLSAFANETDLSFGRRLAFQLILLAIALGYALILSKTLPKAAAEQPNEHR